MSGDAESRLLDALYCGATDANEFSRALTMLGDRYGCRSTALVSINSHLPAGDLLVSTGVIDADVRRLYAEQFAAIDPAPAAFARIPVGAASTTDRMISPEEQKKSPFLHEFYRPIGLAETLGGNLRVDNGRFEIIGLHRGPDRAPFQDSELAEIERLMPHVARALQVRRSFLALETKAFGLETALDRLAAGIVLLDASGTAMFINRAMSAIAKRGDGLAFDPAGRPIPAGSEVRRQLNGLINAVRRGGAGGTLTVPRRGELRPYAVLVAPVPSSLQRAPGDPRGTHCVLVIVHDPASTTLSEPDILQQGLGLPKGAAKLVAALAADDDLKSFAEREGVTIHTARFHLRTALTRTGTRTQAELVRVAVRLLRDFGLRSNGVG